MEIVQKNKLEKSLSLHCQNCKTVYQLIETQLGQNDNCSTNCLKKWKRILQNHHQKKIMAYITKQEEERQTKEEKENNL